MPVFTLRLLGRQSFLFNLKALVLDVRPGLVDLGLFLESFQLLLLRREQVVPLRDGGDVTHRLQGAVALVHVLKENTHGDNDMLHGIMGRYKPVKSPRSPLAPSAWAVLGIAVL